MQFLTPLAFILVGMGFAEMWHIFLYHRKNKRITRKVLNQLYDKGFSQPEMAKHLDVTQFEVTRCWFHNDTFYADRERTNHLLGS